MVSHMTTLVRPKGKKPLPDLSEKPRLIDPVMMGIYVERDFRETIRKAGRDMKTNIRKYIVRALENQLKSDYGE